MKTREMTCKWRWFLASAGFFTIGVFCSIAMEGVFHVPDLWKAITVFACFTVSGIFMVIHFIFRRTAYIRLFDIYIIFLMLLTIASYCRLLESIKGID